MKDLLQKFNRNQEELTWQRKFQLRVIQTDQPIPSLPHPKEASLVVQLLGHEDRELETFDIEKDKFYFFCACYKASGE